MVCFLIKPRRIKMRFLIKPRRIVISIYNKLIFNVIDLLSINRVTICEIPVVCGIIIRPLNSQNDAEG